jgi:hypothetical protein
MRVIDARAGATSMDTAEIEDFEIKPALYKHNAARLLGL